MGDTKTVTINRHRWLVYAGLGETEIVLASFVPETLVGNLIQFVMIWLGVLVMFQGGVLYQLAYPQTAPTVLRRRHIALAVLLIGLFLLAESSATRGLLGSFAAMAFFTLGDIWCFWKRREKP